MIGLTQTISIVVAAKVIVRGVETPDWTDTTVTEVKAHVYYESTGLTQGAGPGLTFTRQLTALMRPVELEVGFTRIRWQGDDYSILAPEVRYRYGKPEFQAVRLSGSA